MALSYAVSIGLKYSVVYDFLEHLLDQPDFTALKNIYCGKDSYTNESQGETIEYCTNYPESRDALIAIESRDKLVECKVYNHNNNIKICRRDFKSYPIKEDEHIFTYDFRTGRSSASCIKRDVYISNDNENAKVTDYEKIVFECDGSICEYENTVRKNDNVKKRKYF